MTHCKAFDMNAPGRKKVHGTPDLSTSNFFFAMENADTVFLGNVNCAA